MCLITGWRWRSLGLVALFLGAPLAAVGAADPVEVKIIVRSSGSGPDEVGFVYSTTAKGQKARQTLEARARQDFQRLAAEFGQTGTAPKISTVSEPKQAPPTTSAEGKLPGLVNRPAGWLNIGPFLKVFSRYDRLSLTYFVEPPFKLNGPRGPFDDPTLAMSLDEGGIAYTYDVRIKHAPGQEGAPLPAFAVPSGPFAALGKAVYGLVALMALAVGAAVYALLQLWTQKKRAAAS